jgi:phosphoribosylglycinamide formyltransferase-1
MAKLKLGVLVSGRGTNLSAILDAIAKGVLDAEVRLVISNRAGAAALERATRAGVPVRVIAHGDHADRATFETHLVEALREASVSLVVLAGFMRILTSVFLEAFPHRIINIHPALLPAFPGLHPQRDAIAYGVKLAGCTVHFADPHADGGAVIAQAAVPVLDEDTEASLAARILEQEHRLLVAVLCAMAAGEVEICPAPEGGRLRVKTSNLAARLFAGNQV